MNDDDLAPARGVIDGTCLAALLWIAAFAAWWLL